MVFVRTAILKALTAAAVLLFILIVAGSLWGLLGALGDRDMAIIMQGIVLITGVCFFLDLIALIILNSIALVASPTTSSSDEPFESTSLHE